MKNIQKQQYTFQDFERHVSLYNIVPTGKGDSLILLKKIVEGIQGGYFKRNPSILISGEGASTLALAFGNTLCSEDIRCCEAVYLCSSMSQMDLFGNSLFDTIHIVQNVERMGMSEAVLWHLLKRREYKFTSFDRKHSEYIHLNGIIILTSQKIDGVSSPLLNAVDFRVQLETYSQDQLELLVKQRLDFCRIDYGDKREVLRTIVEYSNGELQRIIDLANLCILLVQSNTLTTECVEKAAKLCF